MTLDNPIRGPGHTFNNLGELLLPLEMNMLPEASGGPHAMRGTCPKINVTS